MTQISAVLGGQWGDEGKGKIVDMLAEEYDIIVRATGGANAGHSVYVDIDHHEHKFIFRLVPSGLIYPNKIGVIGNGCVVHIPTMFDEISKLKEIGIDCSGRLFVSNRAHFVFEYHKELDHIQEERRKAGGVGTTKRGIGPCYIDKIGRYGIRLGDLFDFERFEFRYRANIANFENTYGVKFSFNPDEELHELEDHLATLQTMVIDTAFYLNQQRLGGKKILLEGANGALLDVDHGTYPYVTSSNPTVGGLFTGTGLAPSHVDEYIGIFKAYATRVGSGNFPTELTNEVGNTLRERGVEYGSVTGRPRRCGWFDLVAARYVCMINGYDFINLTKLDVLSGFPEIAVGMKYTVRGQVCNSFPASLVDLDECTVDYEELEGWNDDISQIRRFKDLPQSCQKYVTFLEENLQCPIKYIGVGRKRGAMIVRES